MGFRDWFRPRRISLAFGYMGPRPLVIVNGNVDRETLRGLGGADGGDADARAVVVRDVEGFAPMAVLHFGVRLAFDREQIQVIGHEVSHLVSQILGLRVDPTHNEPQGRELVT